MDYNNCNFAWNTNHKERTGNDASVKSFLPLRFWSVVAVFAPLSGLLTVVSAM
jgi:hypothetical protein